MTQEEFLEKLAPCLEHGDLDACVEEAAKLAKEMGIGAKDLLGLSSAQGDRGDHGLAYVLALAAAWSLTAPYKANAYYNAALASKSLGRSTEAEDHYKKALEIDHNFAEAHYNYANLLADLRRNTEAEDHYKKGMCLALINLLRSILETMSTRRII
jgi:tetratricopeptide (TPR) repeat protein